jgi:NAD(P)H-hydrate repair Nnr-like enzyme with NAD(P)H-hydrate dehydratase domain
VPGLGTAGSGDVRSGLVAGTAARCTDAEQAACWARTYMSPRALVSQSGSVPLATSPASYWTRCPM